MSSAKPRLRGVSHEIACYASGIAGCYLVAQARGPGETQLALTGATIYSLCLFFQFVASALYHRPTWSAAARARMRKLDHLAIYLLIAGTATPTALLGLQGSLRALALALAWTGAALGLLKELFWAQAPKPLSAAAYVLLGAALVPFLPAIAARLGSEPVWLLLSGALIYAAGAAVYAFKRPDPLPAVFGYHEVFHALVVVAAAVQFAAIHQIVVTIARQ